jgi:phosphohistidine phosphatase SixA
MSVHSIQNSQASQTEAVSQAQAAQKQASQKNTLPVDKVTISAAAQAKQTASSIGANLDRDHDGK